MRIVAILVLTAMTFGAIKLVSVLRQASYDQGLDDAKMMADLVGLMSPEEKARLVGEAMARHPSAQSPARQLQPCRFYDPPGLWCAPCRRSDFANCTDKR